MDIELMARMSGLDDTSGRALFCAPVHSVSPPPAMINPPPFSPDCGGRGREAAEDVGELGGELADGGGLHRRTPGPRWGPER